MHYTVYKDNNQKVGSWSFRQLFIS